MSKVELAQVRIYKSDRDGLALLAKKHRTTIAEVVRRIKKAAKAKAKND